MSIIEGLKSTYRSLRFTVLDDNHTTPPFSIITDRQVGTGEDKLCFSKCFTKLFLYYFFILRHFIYQRDVYIVLIFESFHLQRLFRKLIYIYSGTKALDQISLVIDKLLSFKIVCPRINQLILLPQR